MRRLPPRDTHTAAAGRRPPQVLVTDPAELEKIRDREADITRERVRRIIDAGARLACPFVPCCRFRGCICGAAPPQARAPRDPPARRRRVARLPVRLLRLRPPPRSP
jgi:hypothetical protein